jgi:hypothetical protein
MIVSESIGLICKVYSISRKRREKLMLSKWKGKENKW